MLFNSFAFAIFFPVVSIAYFATPQRWRWLLLLAASCVFYMAFIPAYVLILFGMILLDYVAGILIERAHGGRRKAMLAISLASNVGVLAVFKYYDFAARTLTAVAQLFHTTTGIPLLGWILPIGLSFHTFQAMAYTIEVYRGTVPAERHLGYYALYVMFYPQLVAGPIERPQNLLPQIRASHSFDPDRIVAGLKLMAWGLFKKVVIADRLAATVNTIYALPRLYSGPVLMLATFFFSWQIYCDFSGYSDMAVGAAQVMGFRLMRNFNRPYLARSIREFWTRWHISLSTWFRDYVYIPLGGSRGSTSHWLINLTITFVVSGLWHGANWTFVLWGALNGLYLAVGVLTAPFRERLRVVTGLERLPAVKHFVQTTVTFLLITSTWTFFRAADTRDAMYILGHLTERTGLGVSALGVPIFELALGCILIAGLTVVEVYQPGEDPRAYLSESPAWTRWTVYYALIALTISLGMFTRSPFIYFQF